MASAQEHHGPQQGAVIGPRLPGEMEHGKDDGGDKALAAPAPRRVMGPSLPPSNSERVSDPGMSSAVRAFLEREERMKQAVNQADDDAETRPSAPAKREEWMLSMPSAQTFTDALQQDASLALKGRGFSQAAGKRVQSRGSAVTGQEDASLWTETPAERERRLRDEELGVRAKATSSSALSPENEQRLEEERRREAKIARAVAEHNAKRGPSLLDQHQAKRREELKNKDSKSRQRDRGSDDSSTYDSEEERRRRRRKRREHEKRRHESDASSSDDDTPAKQGRNTSMRQGKTSRRHDDGSSRHSRRNDETHSSSRRHRRHREDDYASESGSHPKREKSDRHSSSHHSSSRDRRHRHDKRDRRRGENEDDGSTHASARRPEKPVSKRDTRQPDAPMMVWDRDAAMSVGGRLMGEKQRMDTIRSAAGLADRFSGASGGASGSRFL